MPPSTWRRPWLSACTRRWPNGGWRVLVAFVFVFAGVIAACGDRVSPSPTAARSSTPEASLTPLRSASPSPTATATSGATTFESVVYPYRLTTYELTTWPETLLGPWHPAERAWDGEERVDLPGPLADQDRIAEGDFYVFGATAPDGLEPFVDRVAGNGERFHACSTISSVKVAVLLPDDPPPGELPKGFVVPGFEFWQTCEQGTALVGLAFVCDGFGFGVLVATAPGMREAAYSRIADYTMPGMYFTGGIARACGE